MILTNSILCSLDSKERLRLHSNGHPAVCRAVCWHHEPQQPRQRLGWHRAPSDCVLPLQWLYKDIGLSARPQRYYHIKVLAHTVLSAERHLPTDKPRGPPTKQSDPMWQWPDPQGNSGCWSYHYEHRTMHEGHRGDFIETDYKKTISTLLWMSTDYM